MHPQSNSQIAAFIVFIVASLFLCTSTADAQHKQTVLADIFTNSHCSPCATMHAAVDSHIKGKEDQYGVIIVYHHLRVYADDPIYQDNQTEPGARANFLGGVLGTPTVFFNGKKWTSSYSGWPSYLSAETQMLSDYLITGTLTTTADSAFITCSISRSNENVQDVNLYSVLVENVTYRGRNGVSDHNGAMRVGFTNAAGMPLTFDSNGNSTVNLSAPIKSNWDRSKLRAVFVAQDPETGQTYQAHQVSSGQATSVEMTNVAANFSNAPAKLELYSSTGQLISASSVSSYSQQAIENAVRIISSQLPTSLYYVRVSQGESFYIKSELVVR